MSLRRFGQKAKRFWISLVIGFAIVAPAYYYVKAHFPLVHKAFNVFAGIATLYFALRYIYEHWED